MMSVAGSTAIKGTIHTGSVMYTWSSMFFGLSLRTQEMRRVGTSAKQ